jgi:hypothetical protein
VEEGLADYEAENKWQGLWPHIWKACLRVSLSIVVDGGIA